MSTTPTTPTQEERSSKIPLLVAGFLVIAIGSAVISGDAKLTTNNGCQEWLDEVALDDMLDGFNPPDAANFYGLGIGVCFLEQTDI